MESWTGPQRQGPKQTVAGPARTDGRPERKARAARAKQAPSSEE